MQKRFNLSDNELLQNMEELASKMEGMSHEEIVNLYGQTREVTELDFMIAKIDSIQAELWRRSQVGGNNGQSGIQNLPANDDEGG